MKSMLVLFAAALLSLPSPRVGAQAGTGNLYRVTTKMEMVGMPFAMPARTNEVCGPKEGGGQAMVPHQDNCQVLDFQINGNKSSFRMVCTGREAMTGTGEFEMLGAAGYRGKITAEMEGMQMVMNFDGKKIGDCNYATDSPQAKGQAMIAKSCDQMLAQPGDALILAGANFREGTMCHSRMSAFCGKVLPLTNDLKAIRNIDATDASMRQSGQTDNAPWETMRACGLAGRSAVMAKACPKALATGDVDFITSFCPAQVEAACAKADAVHSADFLVEHCPARAQGIAAQQCAGRDFTALMGSPYAGFCGKMAGKRLKSKPN